MNLITGNKETVKAPADIRFNGIGYNIQDDFIYGAYAGSSSGSSASASNDIVKLDADGNYTIIDVPNLPSSTYEAGDIDANGNLYLYSSSATTVYKINLETLSVISINLSGRANLADISVSDDGSKIWGVSSNTGSFVTYTNANQSIRDGYGGAITSMNFYDNRGNLFMISELSGNLFLVNPDGGDIERISDNDDFRYYQGDGAQCRNASVYSNEQPSFGCESGVGYIVDQVNSNMYKMNGATGESSLVKEDISPRNVTEPNNMGYNPKDGYLWAYNNKKTNQLMRIGSDYSVQYFPIADLSETGEYGAGEFSPDGVFYLYNGHKPTSIIRRLDLNPSSATYLQFLPDLVIHPVGFSSSSALADIALNPADGKLYAISENSSLMQIDPANGDMHSLGRITGGATKSTEVVIISFTDPYGNLYFQRARSSDMWKIDSVQTGNLETQLYKSGLRNITSGDGARCPTALFHKALFVLFDHVSAFTQDGMLQVSWQTLKETNNDYFEIEVSKDGKHFHNIKSVNSKATNGNSDTSIQYKENILLSNLAVMGISLFLLSMGAMWRRSKWLGMALIATGFSVMLYSCTKEDAIFFPTEKNIYVRIKQVDKDGAASYSKVITAIRK